MLTSTAADESETACRRDFKVILATPASYSLTVTPLVNGKLSDQATTVPIRVAASR